MAAMAWRRIGAGRDQMVGVARHADAGEFGIRIARSAAGMLGSLQNKQASAFAEDHAVAVAIERSQSDAAAHRCAAKEPEGCRRPRANRA